MQHNSDRQRSLFVFSWGIIAVALLAALLIRALLMQVYFVPSASMQPTLSPGDRVLVEKVTRWWAAPGLGQLVVFDGTDVWGNAANGRLVTKRVVGVAGDHLVCCDREGRLRRNGLAVVEPYAIGRTAVFDIVVPEGRLWVLGDNRQRSLDSNTYRNSAGGGSVPVNHVVGRALAVVWPPAHAGILTAPQYGGST